MRFEIEDRSGVPVIRLHGELNGDDSGEFSAAAARSVDGSRRGVVLALGDVNFMTSAGLGELVKVAARANAVGRNAVLAEPTPFVAGVLETTRLNRFFEVRSSLEEAISALS